MKTSPEELPLTSMGIKRGRRLATGIGIVSTGGPLSEERLGKGLSSISSLGFKSFAPLSPAKYYANYTHGFSNGSPEERLHSITEILKNDEAEIMLASRGATGALEIISDFPFSLAQQQRKLLIGQSDVTCLLVQMPSRARIPAIHGPTLGAEFADYSSSEAAKESVDTLISLLTNPDYSYSLPGQILKRGTPAEGFLLAGNLSMLVSLLGTPWDVSYKEAILILEEVGEAPFRVERMLTQLYLSGKLGELAGLCFGRFSRCESLAGPTVDEVIERFVRRYLSKHDYPILNEIPVGHWGKSLPVPIGCRGVIDENQIKLLESPIE